MRILAGVISFGRILFGIAFIARPKLMDDGWIGRQARLPGTQVLARGVGSRDLAVGLGALQAVIRNDGSARSWMAASALCDAVDAGATLAAGRRIPRTSRNGVIAIASTFAVLSALTAVALGRPRHAEPLDLSGTTDVTEAGAVPSEPIGTA